MPEEALLLEELTEALVDELADALMLELEVLLDEALLATLVALDRLLLWLAEVPLDAVPPPLPPQAHRALSSRGSRCRISLRERRCRGAYMTEGKRAGAAFWATQHAGNGDFRRSAMEA